MTYVDNEQVARDKFARLFEPGDPIAEAMEPRAERARDAVNAQARVIKVRKHAFEGVRPGKERRRRKGYLLRELRARGVVR